MLHFKAKMYQIHFPLGSIQTLLGELTVLPGPLAVFKRPTSKKRERRGGKKR